MTMALRTIDPTDGYDRIRRRRRPTGAPVAGDAVAPLILRRATNSLPVPVQQIGSAVAPAITAPYGYGVNERPGNAVPPLANDIGSVAQVQDAAQATREAQQNLLSQQRQADIARRGNLETGFIQSDTDRIRRSQATLDALRSPDGLTVEPRNPIATRDALAATGGNFRYSPAAPTPEIARLARGRAGLSTGPESLPTPAPDLDRIARANAALAGGLQGEGYTSAEDAAGHAAKTKALRERRLQLADAATERLRRGADIAAQQAKAREDARLARMRPGQAEYFQGRLRRPDGVPESLAQFQARQRSEDAAFANSPAGLAGIEAQGRVAASQAGAKPIVYGPNSGVLDPVTGKPIVKSTPITKPAPRTDEEKRAAQEIDTITANIAGYNALINDPSVPEVSTGSVVGKDRYRQFIAEDTAKLNAYSTKYPHLAGAVGGGKIRVSNGAQTFEIDESDLASAERDGFKRVN